MLSNCITHGSAGRLARDVHTWPQSVRRTGPLALSWSTRDKEKRRSVKHTTLCLRARKFLPVFGVLPSYTFKIGTSSNVSLNLTDILATIASFSCIRVVVLEDSLVCERVWSMTWNFPHCEVSSYVICGVPKNITPKKALISSRACVL